MSVLILGETMPSVCWGCPLCYDDYYCTGLEKRIDTNLYKEKLPDCPLLELPPHGRLIDADALCYQLSKQETIDGQPRAIRRARKIVMEFPTILEAEDHE